MNNHILKIMPHTALTFLCVCLNVSVWALPVGGQVNGGSAVLTTNANTLFIEQGSQQLSLQFEQFNIGVNERVTFLQPNRDAVALNRIVGGNASELLGQLESNGQVFLINPHGILFGRNSQLNVGGLMATTLNINDDDFFNGRWSFSAMEGITEFNSSIQNLGHISALNNGYIALVAPNILNEGSLNAPNGSVALHSADAVVMSFAGQQLLSIETDQASLNAAIKNSGGIYADGGQVLLTAAATNGLLKTVIDNSGIISAQRIEQSGGRIFLIATDTTEQGEILNSGLIIANQQTDGNGGSIEIMGGKIAQLGIIDVDGQGNGSGGNINVYAQDGIVIANKSLTSANGGHIGDGGMIRYFTFGQAAFYNGSALVAKGGQNSGNGGFIEVSGVQQVLIDGLADTSAAHGNTGLFYIDPTDIDIVAGVGEVNGAFVTGGGFSDWLPDTVGSSDIGTDLITTLLASNNVTIDTAAANTGADTGTLTVSVDIDLNGGDGQTLTLRSNNLMTIVSDICDMGGGASCLASPDDAVNLFFDTKANAANGHISIGGIEINSGGGDITFTSDAGLTLGAGGTFNSGVGNILATIDDTIQLGGSTNISSTTGTIGLTSTLQSITTAANTSITSSSAAISLNANQAITMVDTSSINSGSASLALTTTNGDVTLTGLVSTKTASSNVITVSSGGSILDGGDTNIDLSAVNGDITLTADTGIVNLEINGAEGNFTNTVSGNIVINESDDIEIQTINAVADFELNSLGSIDLITGALTSVQRLDLDASDNLVIPNAGINIGSGATQILNLRGSDIYNKDLSRPLTLTAESLSFTSSLTGGDTTITSNVANLSVVKSSINTITVNEADALVVLLASMNNGTININSGAGSDLTLNTAGAFFTGGGGGLSLTAGNDLNIDANIAGAASVTNINLNATAGSINVAGGVSIESGGGNIVLAANAASQVVTVAGSASVNSAIGKIIISGDTVIISGITSTNSDDDAISITSNTDIQDNGSGADVTAVNGGVVLVANTGIHDTTGLLSFDVNAAKIDATNSVSGAINLDVKNGSEIIDLDSVGDFTLVTNAGNNDVSISNITAIGGAIDMTVGGTLTIPDTGLTSSTTLTINVADIVDSVGSVSLGGTVADITLGNITGGRVISSSFDSVSLTSTGSDTISINDSNALVITDIHATDNVSITSSAGAAGIVINGFTASQGLTITANAGVSIADGVLVDAGSGDINITAFTNDISVTGLKTTSSSSTAITLFASGSITDSGASNIDISAVNGGIKLTSDTGMDDLEIQVASLDATNNISGNIVINEVDDLSITQLSNAGDITVNTSGNLSLDSNLDLNGMDGSTLTFNAVGNLTLNANVCEGGDTCVAVDDGVTLDFDTGGDFTMAVNIAIHSGAGNVNVNAVGAVTFNAGDSLVSDGDIFIAGNSVRIAGIQSNSTSATAVQISSASNILNRAGIDITATLGGVVLTASTGITALETNVVSLSVTNTTSGDIVINESNDLSITQLSNVGGITVNTSGNLTLDSHLNLNGMDGSTLTLNAVGDLTLNANICEGAALCASIDDVVILDFHAGGDITTIGNVTVDSGGGDVSLDALGTMSLSQGDVVNAGDGQISVTGNAVIITGLQSTATGNAITVTSATDIRERSGNDASAINGVVTLNAVSGIRGGGLTADVDVVAQSISVNNTTSGEVRLGGGTNDVTLSQVDVAGLMLVNTTSGTITLQENALLAANAITFNSDTGTIVLPSAISLSGRLTLIGAQVTNTDQNLIVSAQELLLKASENQDLVINVNGTIVDISMLGDGDLQVNSSSGLTVADLDADGSAVSVSNGNVLLNTLAGNLNIEADVSASDTAVNGVRSGMIELSVTGGDLIVGLLNPVAITSTNNVDQNESGGLTDASDSQVSIYAHLNGQDNVNRTITLGDSNGDDVTLLAVGGDITLDAFNGANFVNANNRNVLINTDVTLTSYNQVSDEQTGTVTSEGIVNNGLVQAHLNRQISLIANGISLSQDEIEVIKETVANEVQDNKPTEIVSDTASEQVGTDVDVAFSAAFDQCSVSSNEEEGNCGAQLAIKKFLGSLLIGGKLPSL